MRQGLGRGVTVAATSAAVTVFVAFGPGAAISHASGTASPEQHCQSFAYQQDAQAEWEKWGPSDPWRWDPDGNGKVCESSPGRPASSTHAAVLSAGAAVSAVDTTAPAAGPATGSTPPGATSAPEDTSPIGASAPPESQWSTETPWSGIHTWDDGKGWEANPRPVGGVQAGGGGQAAGGGTPVVPLAGVAIGALLLTAGAKGRRRPST
jgi:hypothetical protein